MIQNHWYYLTLKSCLATALLLLGLQGASAQETHCITSGGGSDQIRGTTANGYTHELWNQNAQGEACMTVNSDTTFSAEWSNAFNFLARRGLGYDGSLLTPEERGNFTINYASDYNCGSMNGLSYLSVYGWTRDFAKEDANPEGSEEHKEALVEYYIIETWCEWNVSMPDENGIIQSEHLGTLNVDGSTYDIYRTERIDKPAIRCDERYMNSDRSNCDTDFYQYFSIRQTTRNSGTIDVSAHFNRWEELTGVPLGGLHEVMMKVEGYNGDNQSGGDATISDLEVTATNDSPVTFGKDVYVIDQYDPDLSQFPPVATFVMHDGGSFPDITVESSDTSVLQVGGQLTYQFMVGLCAGSADITLYSPEGEVWDTAYVKVNGNECASASFITYELAAQGTLGGERISVTLDGVPMNSHILSTDYEVYSGVFVGNGEVSVEFVNDDGVANGRDVRLDYLEVNGERLETEDMTYNNAAYDNGVCGGGSYTEWLHCNGSVNYGEFDGAHTITIRARGNAGGEHINLLIDGEPVNGGWWLGTSYQEYTASVSGDGDINVEFDNDGGLRDVVIDWVRVDDQVPRQAENMEYNTGAWANGQCGGGSHTQWLHCNGVIGFGNISDNFN